MWLIRRKITPVRVASAPMSCPSRHVILFNPASRHQTREKDYKNGVYRIRNDKRRKSSQKFIIRPETVRHSSCPFQPQELSPDIRIVHNTHLDTRHGFACPSSVVIEFPAPGIAAVDINQTGIQACPSGLVISVPQRDLPQGRFPSSMNQFSPGRWNPEWNAAPSGISCQPEIPSNRPCGARKQSHPGVP